MGHDKATMKYGFYSGVVSQAVKRKSHSKLAYPQ